jgi:hypothetical protein
VSTLAVTLTSLNIEIVDPIAGSETAHLLALVHLQRIELYITYSPPHSLDDPSQLAFRPFSRYFKPTDPRDVRYYSHPQK